MPKNAPVMVLPIMGEQGPQAVHTTVLSLQGTGKLNDNARRIQGRKKGGFIPLWAGDFVCKTLVVDEGVETTLGWDQRLTICASSRLTICSIAV